MQSNHEAPVSADTDVRQYLTFRLGGLEYALDYGNVQELRPLKALERFAADGEIISGVAVSRGNAGMSTVPASAVARPPQPTPPATPTKSNIRYLTPVPQSAMRSITASPEDQ